MNYQFAPTVRLQGKYNFFEGYSAIIAELSRDARFAPGKVIAFETYPGSDEKLLQAALLDAFSDALVFSSETLFLPRLAYEKMVARNLTDDRVFGVMSNHQLREFIDPSGQKQLQRQLADANQKLVIIYGMGASLVTAADQVVYVDVPRWEIQLKMRAGEVANWRCDNAGTDSEQLIKRGFYLDWPIADRYKKELLSTVDYVLELHRKQPVMMRGEEYRSAMKEVVNQPFSLVPFFDPGVWGGHWMQQTFNHRQEEINLAWSFNGVPEENSLLLEAQNHTFETPGTNLLLLAGEELLGPRVYGRFGDSFPIRFNFLDTVAGENLSLQVHPKLSYIQNVFGLPYTQDESYYILHAEPEASVYLGTKSGVTKEELMVALKAAQTPETGFDSEAYIYRRPAVAHDHFLIPAGTIHSSGKGMVVLEISATPNRFTFKMWDWGRVDLNGRPRPVHLEHAEKNIDLRCNQHFVEKELCNQFEVLATGDGWREERTGLHELEWIETRRHRFTVPVIHENPYGVNVLNLVSGEKAIIDSPDGEFEPMTITYAQTVIIPAQIMRYRITPMGDCERTPCMTVKAFIR